MQCLRSLPQWFRTSLVRIRDGRERGTRLDASVSIDEIKIWGEGLGRTFKREDGMHEKDFEGFPVSEIASFLNVR